MTKNLEEFNPDGSFKDEARLAEAEARVAEAKAAAAELTAEGGTSGEVTD